MGFIPSAVCRGCDRIPNHGLRIPGALSLVGEFANGLGLGRV